MPGYPRVLLGVVDKTLQAELRDVGGAGITRVFAAHMPDSGLPVYIVDCPSLFEREGSPYEDQDGHEWPDNAKRFSHLSQMAAGIATGELMPGWRPRSAC